MMRLGGRWELMSVSMRDLQREIEEEVSEEERRKKMQGRMAELGLALMANPEGHLAHLKELQVRRCLLSPRRWNCI